MSSPVEARNRRREAAREIDELRAADEQRVLKLLGTLGSPEFGGAFGRWPDGTPVGVVGLAALGRLCERGVVRELRDGPWISGFELVGQEAC